MKKISTILTAGLFTLLSATAFACPQGTSLTGGTGANHKGGQCVTMQKAKPQHMQAVKHDAKMTEQHAQASVSAMHRTDQQHTAASMQKDVKHAQQEKTKAAAETKAAKVHLNKAKTDVHKMHMETKPLKS